MGCSTSKLDDEEAVQLCKDRKNFIKQAVEYRTRFASGHAAYIQSLKRVSAALRDYIEEDEPRDFMLDAFTTPAFTPVKKPSTKFISISPKSFPVSSIQSNPNSTIKVSYLRSGGNPSVSVEERPPHSPETVRLEAYSPIHQYGMDGFFAMQSPPVNNSFFSYSPIHRTNIPPPSPRTSQWDFFWNPFSSLDYYGYPTRSSLDHTVLDDVTGLRQVREEEGIPELEEETEEEDLEPRVHSKNEQAKVVANSGRDEVVVEDDNSDDLKDDDDDDDDDYETDSGNESEYELTAPLETELKVKKPIASHKLEVSKSQNAGQVSNQETAISDNRDANEETPGFTVYVNRRPTNMTEVIKDLETQFKIICNSAIEVSTKLEASRAQYSSTTNEFTVVKMLNPVALLRSASSRSSSSRYVTNYSSSKDEAYESSSDFSEESCTFAGSHQSTLDKLYAWEKKLYHEVRAGERIRIAYEKKCSQLHNQDVKGDDPSSVDKTRAAIRDLHTQIKVSIHSVEAVSTRIEILRDEELQPQLLDLVQGLTRMWKVMSECHLSQKRILDDAKLLLAGTPSKLSRTKKYTLMSPSDPHRLACAAANLESELRNWRACFESWITSQRSYIHALTGWLLRCVRSNADSSNLPFSPRRSIATSLPIYGICVQWSRFLDAVREVPVLDGLDFFAAGVGSLYAQQLKEDSRHRTPAGSKRYGGGFSVESGGNMEMVEVGHLEEDAFSTEKMVEVAIRVLCAGMSVAVSSLTEYAMSSAEGYADLVKQWENAQHPGGTSSTQQENVQHSEGT